MNLSLFAGALLGLLSVIMASYTDHALTSHLTDKSLNSLMTAIRYHQLYSIIVCSIGLTLPFQIAKKFKSWLIRASYLFIFGIILFSFSIYISVMFQFQTVVYLVPIGGICFMLGWISLIRTALLKQRN